MDDKTLLSRDVVKIAVLGEPGCGKTDFIHAFMSDHSIYSVFQRAPAVVCSCEFKANNETRRAAIFEFPGDLDTPDLVEAIESCRPNAIVLMYSVDDPSSFRMVTEKYFSTLALFNSDVFSKQAIVLVGSNTERRNNQWIIEWLGQENHAPVTFAEGKKLSERLEMDDFFEYSSYDLNHMKDTFEEILHIALACMDI